MIWLSINPRIKRILLLLVQVVYELYLKFIYSIIIEFVLNYKWIYIKLKKKKKKGKYSLSVWNYSPKLKKTIMKDGIGDVLMDVEILKIKVDEEGKYLFALDEFKRLLVFSLEW